MTDTEKRVIVESLLRLYGKVEILTKKDKQLINDLLEMLGEML